MVLGHIAGKLHSQVELRASEGNKSVEAVKVRYAQYGTIGVVVL
jgi:hypothetical protein